MASSMMGVAAQGGAESREYRWILALTLPVFLVVAALGRLTFRRGAACAHRSLLCEARATAHTVIPFAFMH